MHRDNQTNFTTGTGAKAPKVALPASGTSQAVKNDVSGPHGSTPAAVRHLNQIELASRWSISPRTLERWRWMRQGVVYLKIGGHVVYRLDDIESYEQSNLHKMGAVSVQRGGARR